MCQSSHVCIAAPESALAAPRASFREGPTAIRAVAGGERGGHQNDRLRQRAASLARVLGVQLEVLGW